MKNYTRTYSPVHIIYIISLLPILLMGVSARCYAQSFCEVRQFDESDGLSQRLVKQIVQTPDGFLWVATWNGLNRYDGKNFAKVRPAVDDVARRYSERFSDIRASASGNLWCRVDERLLLFDVRSYRFSDITPQLEKQLGRKVSVQNIWPAREGHTVVKCTDGGYLLLTDTASGYKPVYSEGFPDVRLQSVGNRNIDVVRECPFSDIIYAQRDSLGGSWAITLQGEVCYSAPAGDGWMVVNRLDVPHGTLYYGTTDNLGRVWLKSTVGAFCITMGTCPYQTLSPELPSRIRQIYRDGSGRLWLSESDASVVAVYEATDTMLRHPRYLSPDGFLSARCVSFGSQVYSFTSSADGTVWLGTKPDGLFRLSPRGDGKYSVKRFMHHFSDKNSLSSNNIYDIKYDCYGRLWIATLGGGIDCMPHPGDESPQVVRLAGSGHYPSEALRVRRLHIVGDSLLMAATTGGLLVASLPTAGSLHNFCPHLHVSEPERRESLGNVAVMDVLTDGHGRTFVATESDGVNCLTHRPVAADSVWRFRRLDMASGNTADGISGRLSDVALALATDSGDETLHVVSNNMVYEVNVTAGGVRTYGQSFWHRKLRFTDAVPAMLPDGRWIYGVEDGGVIVDSSSLSSASVDLPLCFTSVSIENRNDSLLSSVCDTVILSSVERCVTLHFAVPCGGDALMYVSRLDGGSWSGAGGVQSVTLLNLTPGVHSLEIAVAGCNVAPRRMTIIVTPTIWQTPLAKLLYILSLLLFVSGVVWIISYIRAIKRKQSETMEAYLKLLNAPVAASATNEVAAPQVDADVEAHSKTDELFMQRVADFINIHLGDADVSIDDMAAATATSRSGLNRKMKSLFGMSPAEFIRESRISRAAMLLTTTDRPVSDIATECGYSDINYFGKCFKARYMATPTAYRKQNVLS